MDMEKEKLFEQTSAITGRAFFLTTKLSLSNNCNKKVPG